MAYGTRAGLRRECTGLDLDRLGSGGELEKILADELDLAEKDVEDRTARLSGAFNHNTAATVTVDGSGTTVIRLAPHGYVPLLNLTALAVDGDDEDLDNFKVYRNGNIEFERSGTDSGTAGVLGSFTPGTQNIEVTIDWGYASVPLAVQRATYLIAKAALMERIAAAIDPTDTAVPPGLIKWQVGEYSVQFDRDGQYGPQIRACRNRAKALLRPYMLVVMDAPRGRRGHRGTDTSDAELAHYRADD